MARRVAPSPNATTSMGSGKRPSTSTSFVSSAMTIILRDAAATIFSRRCAPPPPLMSRSEPSISSAPSTVRSSSGVSSSVVSGTPRRSACARVTSEVGTPTTSRPSSTRSASRSTKCLAVEPVPRPRRIPGRTSATARAAASRFNASRLNVLSSAAAKARPIDHVRHDDARLSHESPMAWLACLACGRLEAWPNRPARPAAL